jgi:hypothetical protein
MKGYLCALLIATATQLQATDVVDVKLVGSRDCENIKGDIQVVVNGDDQNSFPIERVKTAPCRWHGISPIRFKTSTAFFSLHLNGARTPVRHAVDPSDDSMAQLIYIYAPSSAFDVDVNALDKNAKRVPVDYVRRVSADDKKTDVKYDERGQLGLWPPHKIVDVNFEGEDVWLHLPPMRNSDPELLLLVNDVLKDKKRAPLEGASFVDALVHQAQGSKNRSAPTNKAAAARKTYERLVRASRVKQLELARP